MSTSASSALVPLASAAMSPAPPASEPATNMDLGEAVFKMCTIVAHERSRAGENAILTALENVGKGSDAITFKIIDAIEKLASDTDKIASELDQRSQLRTNKIALLLLHKLGQVDDELTTSKEYAKALEKRVAVLEATIASLTGKPIPSAAMPSLDPKDPANLLRKVTRLFHDKQADRAIAEFEEFEKAHPQIAGQVFGHLWTLAGSPKNGPTAHPDFGKVVFYDKHAPYKARNEQKMEAIEAALKALAANTKK